MSKGTAAHTLHTPERSGAWRVPERLSDRLRRWSRARVFTLALALSLLLVVGDYETTAAVAFTLLYLAPIALSSWYVGKRAGQIIAIVCTLGAAASQIVDPVARVHVLIATWAVGTSLGVFLLTVELLDRLRAHVDREERARSAALSQLRHSERLNALGKLAAGVAHEIATPLTAITINAELVASGKRRDAGAEKCATRILDQTERVHAIVSRLLQFGRKGEDGRAQLDLRDVVRKNVDLLRPLADKQRCALEVSVSGEPLIVEGSAVELSQVVTNLVINAVQATPAGGVVSVTCENCGASGASFSVVDTGTGIAPQNLPHLFEPFFTTKAEGGTGLGLSISAGIVEDHGGTVRVASRVGEGSCFTVFLPRADQTGHGASPAPPG
jgi:signal transduction histidine kinase